MITDRDLKTKLMSDFAGCFYTSDYAMGFIVGTFDGGSGVVLLEGHPFLQKLRHYAREASVTSLSDEKGCAWDYTTHLYSAADFKKEFPYEYGCFQLWAERAIEKLKRQSPEDFWPESKELGGVELFLPGYKPVKIDRKAYAEDQRAWRERVSAGLMESVKYLKGIS